MKENWPVRCQIILVYTSQTDILFQVDSHLGCSGSNYRYDTVFFRDYRVYFSSFFFQKLPYRADGIRIRSVIKETFGSPSGRQNADSCFRQIQSFHFIDKAISPFPDRDCLCILRSKKSNSPAAFFRKSSD